MAECLNHKGESAAESPEAEMFAARTSDEIAMTVLFITYNILKGTNCKYNKIWRIYGIYVDRSCPDRPFSWKFYEKDLEVKKKCVSLQPVSEKGVFETFWSETASSLKNEKIWKKFWRFWKSCYLCSPVRNDAGSKKEDHWKDWKTKYKEVQLSTEKTIRER